jgi:predicted transcriptional regulator
MNSGLQTSDDYLQIWHSYLDFLRRSLVPYDENLDEMLKTKRETQIEELRDSFRKAIEQLFEFFKNDGDPLLSLEKYWCLVEAKYLKNMEKARKIFNEMIITRGSLSKYAHDWAEFYEIEKVYGDEKHQRKLLNRAVNEVVESNEKEVIYDLLYKFEKLNGNAHQFNSVYTKYEQFKEMRQLELISKKQIDNSKNFVKKEQSQQKGKPDVIAKKEEKKAPVQQSRETLKRKVNDYFLFLS